MTAPANPFDELGGPLAPGTEILVIVIRHIPTERRPETWTFRYDHATVDKLKSICGEVPTYEMGVKHSPTTVTSLDRVARIKGWVWDFLPDAPAPSLRHQEAGDYPRLKPWVAQRGVGTHVINIGEFATHDEALEAAMQNWRVACKMMIRDAKRTAKSVHDYAELPDEPRILELETGTSGWDALASEDKKQ